MNRLVSGRLGRGGAVQLASSRVASPKLIVDGGIVRYAQGWDGGGGGFGGGGGRKSQEAPGTRAAALWPLCSAGGVPVRGCLVALSRPTPPPRLEMETGFRGAKNSNYYKIRAGVPRWGGKGHVDHAFIREGIEKMNTMQDFLGLCERKGEMFNTVNLTAAVARMHKLSKKKPPQDAEKDWEYERHEAKKKAMALLVELCLKSMADYKPKDIGDLMMSFAKNKQQPGELLASAIARQSVSRADEFIALDCSKLVWSYAILGIDPGDEVIKAMLDVAHGDIEGFNAHTISMLMWAVAKLGKDASFHPLLLGGDLVAAAGDKLKHFEHMEFANFLWACEQIGVGPDEGAAGVISDHLVNNAHKFHTRSIAITLGSLAKLGIRPSESALDAVGREAAVKMSTASTEDLSLLMAAFAAFDTMPHSALVDSWYKQAWDSMSDFNANEVAETLGALGRLELKFDGSMPKRLANLATIYCDDLRPAQAADCIRAIATLGDGRSTPGVKSLLERAWGAEAMTSAEAATLLCAVHEVGQGEEATSAAKERELEASVPSMEADECAEVLTALAAGGYPRSAGRDLVGKLLDRTEALANSMDVGSLVASLTTLVRLGEMQRALEGAIGKRCEELALSFTLGHVVQALWAVASSEAGRGALSHMLCLRAEALVERAGVGGAVAVAMPLAQICGGERLGSSAGSEAPDHVKSAMKAVCERVATELPSASPVIASRFLWACAATGCYPGRETFDAACRRMVGCPRKASARCV